MIDYRHFKKLPSESETMDYGLDYVRSIRADKLSEQIKTDPELSKVTHFRVEMPDGIVRHLSVAHALELGRSAEGPYVSCQPMPAK